MTLNAHAYMTPFEHDKRRLDTQIECHFKVQWQRATELSVYVVRAFLELRGMLSSNQELAAKVHTLERKVSVHKRNIAELVDSMAELLATPPPRQKQSIGFVPQEDKKGSKARKK